MSAYRITRDPMRTRRALAAVSHWANATVAVSFGIVALAQAVKWLWGV